MAKIIVAVVILAWSLWGFVIFSVACSPSGNAEVTPAAPVTDKANSDNASWYEARIDELESRLDGKAADIVALNNQALSLSADLERVNLALGIQTALHEAQLAQMTDLVNRTRQEYFINSGTVNDFQTQYLEAAERLADIDAAFNAVKNGTVIIETDNWTMPLADNLTAAEYSSFLKGFWSWWWTFNEKGDE